MVNTNPKKIMDRILKTSTKKVRQNTTQDVLLKRINKWTDKVADLINDDKVKVTEKYWDAANESGGRYGYSTLPIDYLPEIRYVAKYGVMFPNEIQTEAKELLKLIE